MELSMKRVILSIPAEVASEIEQIKRERFYDKPYAEIYRQMIRLGLDSLKGCGVENERSSSARVR